MTQESQNNGTTRKRLLQVACELFAEKGYKSASIAEITRRADANKAAVNYHFGSKENLYRRAWRYGHDMLSAKFPPDGGVADNANAEERLRGRIRAGLQRSMKGDAIEFRIMRNEMANPTGLLHEVIGDTIQPIRKATQEILRELLGEQCTDTDVELCEVCVVSPWMHVHHRKQAKKHKGLGPVFPEELLDVMVDHFSEYALAGIRAIRKKSQKRSKR